MALLILNRRLTTLTCWLIVSALPIVFLAAGCALVRTVDAQTNLPEAQAQIERRLHEVFVAAESKDFDRLESYHLYATFILAYSFEAGGSTLPKKDRPTMVFVKEDGEWKITHEHLSPIRLAEPGGPANGSQSIRSDTNSTSSAAGFRR